MQVELGMLSNVASTVAHVVEMGRPEVAAACSFAAMVGGNMADVRDITCKMIDQASPNTRDTVDWVWKGNGAAFYQAPTK